MKRLLFPALIVLSSSFGLHAQQQEGVVSVLEPMVRLVRRTELPRFCGPGPNIQACTAFVGQRLDCTCEPSANGWAIASRAQFIPVMFVLGADWVSHERDHVGDIREDVASHLSALGARNFESLEACEDEASSQVASFVSLMDRFKLDSNAARHPRLVRQLASK